MPIANLSNVSEDAGVLSRFMGEVLERVVSVYESYGMPIPERKYWTFGTPVVDCEQIVVSLIQMYVGAPGDEATEPRRCDDPKSATLNISVSRPVPISETGGRAPISRDIEEAVEVCAHDAWVLMESIKNLDSWSDLGYPGLGVIATVEVDPPEGGFQTTRMVITMAVT